MLARGFFDTLAIWPTVVWPLVFSSAFYAFLRLCSVNRKRYGFLLFSRAWLADLLVGRLLVPAAIAFEAVAHSYLLWRIGWAYIPTGIAIYILGWVALPEVLDGIPSATLMLLSVHTVFAAAFLALLGWIDVGILRDFNETLYSMLVGAPVNL
jgi:hypothetical protein